VTISHPVKSVNSSGGVVSNPDQTDIGGEIRLGQQRHRVVVRVAPNGVFSVSAAAGSWLVAAAAIISNVLIKLFVASQRHHQYGTRLSQQPSRPRWRREIFSSVEKSGGIDNRRRRIQRQTEKVHGDQRRRRHGVRQTRGMVLGVWNGMA